MAVKICRVCFEEGDDLKSLGSGGASYGHKLASCVPEIDVYVILNPSICKACLSMVEVAYELRQMCIENENTYKIKRKDCAISGNRVLQTSERTEGSDKQICVSTRSDSEMVFDDSGFCKSGKSYNGSSEEKRSSEDELINSLNKMCAELTDFEEKECANKVVIRDQLFSDEDSRQSFELDLDSLNLLSEDEVNKSEDKSKMVSCKVCKELHSAAYMNAHMKTHDVRNTYDCGRCSKTFSDTCELEAHFLIHLKNLCDVCGKVFRSRSELAGHKPTHATKCCGEKFQTGSLLQLHTYKKHGKSCGICRKTWGNFNALFLHLLEHMGVDDSHRLKYKKTLAYRNLKLDNDRMRSIKTTNQVLIGKTQVKKYYQCKRCQVRCYSRQSYWKHVKHHDVRSRFAYNQCDSSLKHLSDEQFTTDKSDVNAPIECGNCKEKYADTADVSKHKCKVESDWSTCQMCPCKFESPTLLTQHLIKLHCAEEAIVKLVDCQSRASGARLTLNTSEEPPAQTAKLHCHACNATQANFDLYLKHMKMLHSKCDVCNIRLNDVRNVIDHVNRHYKTKNNEEHLQDVTQSMRVGIRVNTDKDLEAQLSVKNVTDYCELCGMEFANQHGYKIHMSKSHMKRHMYFTKLYPCRTCCEVFDTRPELITHKMEHTPCKEIRTNLERHVKFLGGSLPESTSRRQQEATVSNSTSAKPISDQLHQRKCRICGKVFRKTVSLVKHINAVHSRCTIESYVKSENDGEAEILNSPLTLNTNRCVICQEHFDTINELRTHVSVHI